jgi:hypothetical protein
LAKEKILHENSDDGPIFNFDKILNKKDNQPLRNITPQGSNT